MLKKPGKAPDRGSEDIIERFFDNWRKLRRGDMIHKIAPHFLEAPDMLLTTSEADILQEIARLECGSMTDIAKGAHYDPGNTTRTVTQLENKGYVKRTSQKGAGRALAVRLTPRGEEAVRELHSRRKLIFEVAMSELSPKQRRELVDMLDQVTTALRLFTTPAARILLSSHREMPSLGDGTVTLDQ